MAALSGPIKGKSDLAPPVFKPKGFVSYLFSNPNPCRALPDRLSMACPYLPSFPTSLALSALCQKSEPTSEPFYLPLCLDTLPQVPLYCLQELAHMSLSQWGLLWSPCLNEFFLCPVSTYLPLLRKLICLWLHGVLIAALGCSLVAARGGYSLLWCMGFSLRWRRARALGAGLRSCDRRA